MTISGNPEWNLMVQYETALEDIKEVKRRLYKMPVSYGTVDALPDMVELATDEMARRTVALIEAKSEIEDLKAALRRARYCPRCTPVK